MLCWVVGRTLLRVEGTTSVRKRLVWRDLRKEPAKEDKLCRVCREGTVVGWVFVGFRVGCREGTVYGEGWVRTDFYGPPIV